MMRMAADENFNRRIVRGLLRKVPGLDIVRVQDVDLSGADDPAVLEWAAHEGRTILTHDVSTMSDHAYARFGRGERMAGLIEVPEWLPIGKAITDLMIVIDCSLEGEWDGQVMYLPL